MQLKNILASFALAASTFITTMPANAQEVLTGDTRLACEAVLCLASGTRPSECTPSLSRYFSIKFKKWSDTLRGRINFLNLCPAASMDSNMQRLVNAIGSGAGRCDAASLNSSLQMWNGTTEGGSVMISNQMPDYCAAYTSHAYTDLKSIKPAYVGTPERGGYWVEPAQYQQALAEYNARIAAEDEARRRGESGN